MLTPEVLRGMERSVLCWLATADELGRPNVSPKEVFAPEGTTHFLIANIASPGSVRNLRANPRACVSMVDVFVQKGWKLEGRAEVVDRADPCFEALAAPLRARAGERFPVLGVIRLAVENVTPILAPSYRMVPGTTEASQVEAAMAAYGVRARE